MPEAVEDGGVRLSEEAEREQKALADARASLEELLVHERIRRRHRWVFFGLLGLGLLVVLPLIALYVGFVIKLALSVA